MVITCRVLFILETSTTKIFGFLEFSTDNGQWRVGNEAGVHYMWFFGVELLIKQTWSESDELVFLCSVRYVLYVLYVVFDMSWSYPILGNSQLKTSIRVLNQDSEKRIQRD